MFLIIRFISGVTDAVDHGSSLVGPNPLAHGSKDPRWREPFEKLFLKAARNSERVKLACMEFTGPTLPDGADECARENFESLRVLPLFMAAGAHLASDVPEQIGQVSERYPRMHMEVLPPVGDDPRAISLIEHLIREKPW